MPVGNHSNETTPFSESSDAYDEGATEPSDEEVREGLTSALKRQGYSTGREGGDQVDYVMKWARQPIMMRVTKYKDLYGRFWQLNCPTNASELVNHYNDHTEPGYFQEEEEKNPFADVLYYPTGQKNGAAEREVLDRSSYFSDTIWLTYDDFSIVTVRYHNFCLFSLADLTRHSPSLAERSSVEARC